MSLFSRIRNLFQSQSTTKDSPSPSTPVTPSPSLSSPTPSSSLAPLEAIEEILYTSDLGSGTVERLMAALRKRLSRSQLKSLEEIRSALREEFLHIFQALPSSPPLLNLSEGRGREGAGPEVWMVVGVNGAGKTTSIGKMGVQLTQAGRRVWILAGDTFRAAAGGQLKTWAERSGAYFFSPEGIRDPSAVVFEGLTRALGDPEGVDVVIVDTAGRLHTQANLMEELKKMKRVMGRVIPGAPHQVLIVLDANNGQNALVQAKEFHRNLHLTGAILTKLDGTARGGVALGLAHEVKVPIHLVGVGEKPQDLQAFDPQDFVESLLLS